MIQIERDFIVLRDIPMPPSVNKAYASVIAKRKEDWSDYFTSKGKPKFYQKRVSSKDLKQFKEDMFCWSMGPKLEGTLATARQLLDMHIKRKELLEVQRYFFFHRESIFTLKGEPKANDVTNRIKALDDSLAQLLLVDDKHFVSGTEMKVPTTSRDEKERVLVIIRPIRFLDLTENMILMEQNCSL